MHFDIDLDELRVDETLLQALGRGLTPLEASFPSQSAEPMAFDLGICTLLLGHGLFDRLVCRCLLYNKDNPNANASVSLQDQELCRLGLLEIKDKSDGVYYFMGEPTTTTTTYDVSITHTGRVVLKLAGVMGIIESFIRQGLFSLLAVLLSRVDREWLPELLAHGTPRVRELASERLAQLGE